jgi:hypothetical protein
MRRSSFTADPQYYGFVRRHPCGGVQLIFLQAKVASNILKIACFSGRARSVPAISPAQEIRSWLPRYRSNVLSTNDT